MNRTHWSIAGAVTTAMLLLAAVFVAVRPAGAQQTPAATTVNRSVTVVGNGQIKGRPDTAIVNLGVNTQGKTAKEALNLNNQQAAAVQKKLTDLGVDAKDIQTSGFSIYPTYTTDGSQINGYTVSNMVTVKIRNLDKAGTLLDQVVQVGANNVSGISFTIDNPRVLEDQAREQAMRDAKARADVLAKAGGASVGEVMIITENIGSPIPVPMALAARAEADSSAQVPVQAGELTVSVSVQVSYALR